MTHGQKAGKCASCSIDAILIVSHSLLSLLDQLRLKVLRLHYGQQKGLNFQGHAPLPPLFKASGCVEFWGSGPPDLGLFLSEIYSIVIEGQTIREGGGVRD